MFKLHIYDVGIGRWWWRLDDRDGHPIAAGTQAAASSDAARAAFELVAEAFAGPIETVVGGR